MTFLKKWWVNLFLIAAAAGLCIYAHIRSGEMSRQIAAKEAEISEAYQSTGTQSVEISESEVVSVKDATGLDLNRFRADMSSLDEILAVALNWSSADEYAETRTILLSDDYKGVISDSFFTEFFPELRKDENDKYIVPNFYGSEMNMSYSGEDAVELYVLDVKADGSYDYLAEVTVSSSIQDVSGVGQCMFMFTASPDGTISDLNGYMITK